MAAPKRHHRAGEKEIRRNAFADRLAEHGNRTLAAREIGVSQPYGRTLWGEIVRGLGPQAQ